ncbi:MAG: ABC transporter substrate-binding protein, partial [Deltaproteobacteria bacterium]|nr:ABC transporter substrate-binding protein [Deltaproteobacteria bacterium]
MKGTRHNYLWGLCFATIMLIIFIFAFRPLAGLAAQTGDVIYAVSADSFGRVGGDPATFSGGSGPSVSHTVFDGLTIEDMDKRDVPAIAKSWKVAPGWKYVDFFLRDDVKFHDGNPVTAEDVKFSLETYMRKELKFLFYPILSRKIKAIEVKNPYHLRVHFNTSYMGFWGQFGFGGGVMPKAYREKVGDKGFADKPIGAGPFKWIDYRQDQWFLLEAVKNHYRHTPEYKTLKFVYVPEHSTRLAMLKAGEADIISLIGPHIPPVKADPNLRIVYSPYVTGTVLAFGDLRRPKDPSPFHDIRVRKAASLAIDRKIICKKILFNASEPWGEVLAPVTLGYDPSVKPDPYDPEAAKALLAEAGYANGFETTLNVPISSKYWAEAIAANLADVGIKAKVELYEGGTWIKVFRFKKLRGLVST